MLSGFNFIGADEAKNTGRVMCLYGAGGTFKTSTLSQFAGVVIGQDGNRGGARALVAGGARVMSLNTLEDLGKFADLCVANAGEIKAIGLDDFDFMLSRAIMANKANVKTAAVFDEGKLGKKANAFEPYTLAFDKALPALQKIMALRHQGIHVIITCGAKEEDEWATDGDRAKLRKLIHPALPTSIREYVVRMSDLIIYTAATAGGVQGLTRTSVNEKRRIVAKTTIGIELSQVIPMTISGSVLVAAMERKTVKAK